MEAKQVRVNDHQYRRVVRYTKPDAENRTAWGWVVGEPMTYAKHQQDGRNVRSYAVAVLWMDGMVTVEDADDIETLEQ